MRDSDEPRQEQTRRFQLEEFYGKLLNAFRNAYGPHPRTVTKVDIEGLDRLVEESPELLDGIRMEHGAWHIQSVSNAVIPLLEANQHAFGLAVIQSYSRNGRIREAATRNLITLGERSLPFLLIRSCDWVEPISQLASSSAAILMPLATDSTLEKCVRAIPVLKTYPQGTQLLESLLVELSIRNAVLKNTRWESTLNALTILMDRQVCGPDEDWETVVRSGLKYPDNRVVQRSVQAIRSFPFEQRKDLLDELSRHPAKVARLEAVEIADSLADIDALRRFLLDNVWRIRLSARYSLERLGVANFADTYRAAIPSIAAVAGFGEVASDSELAELVPILSSGSTKSICAALAAFENRQFTAAVPSVEPLLRDSRPTVIRRAVRTLNHLGFRMESSALLKLFHEDQDLARKEALAEALDLVRRWDAISLALDLCADEPLIPSMKFWIIRWFTKRTHDYSGPSPGQLAQLQGSLDEAKCRLPISYVEEIQSEINHWSARHRRH